jgi:hypothetical protein
MGDEGVLAGFALVALTALPALVALLAALARPAARRAGLVASALPLALLPPVVATGYGSWELVRHFSGLVASPGATGEDLLSTFARLWLVPRVAWGAFAAACVVGVAVSLSGLLASREADGPRCSARRAAVLLLLPVLALLVAFLAARPLARALRVCSAVVSADGTGTATHTRAEAALEAEGLGGTPSGSIGRISAFVSRGVVLGVLGGVLGVLVLVGLALPGFVLAWRVGFGTAFTLAASAAWVVAGGMASLVALGVVSPLVQP